MNIVAIHDGHCATVCHLEAGKVAHMVSEERFTNKKNQGGYPRRSLEWLERETGRALNDFDAIVFPHLTPPIDYGRQYWGEHADFRRGLFLVLNHVLPTAVMGSELLLPPYRFIFDRVRRRRLAQYARRCGLRRDRIVQSEHHGAHAFAALYASGFTHRCDQVLLFTADDSGDGLSSTVGLWDRRDGYKRLQRTQTFHSLGDLYSRVTQFMGMKPGEHEYKLMGMAPYVEDEHSQRLFEVFRGYMDFDPKLGRFVRRESYGPALLRRLRRDLYLQRFDNVCGAIQRIFEHLVVNWVQHWARRTGVRVAAFGGGSFMNVKGNMLVAALPEFDDVFFCPSCGDDSVAMGAAYQVAAQRGEPELHPLTSIYTGPAYGPGEVRAALDRFSGQVAWEEVPDIDARVVELLVEGKIVGRFKGRSEWGARALGGRSILCRADDLKIIHKLNKAIKMRDFWMPFAASILAEDADRYVVNPKRLASPFMMLTFHTTPAAREEITAGLHPFDHTCRPQLLNAAESPDYHRLLTLFKQRTGFSGLLNTSFNLHGFPIVGPPETAIETLVRSQLDYVAIENLLVWRRQ